MFGKRALLMWLLVYLLASVYTWHDYTNITFGEVIAKKARCDDGKTMPKDVVICWVSVEGIN